MLHDELLKQARELTTLDARRPRQANLRRAISSAYYALFHLLLHDDLGAKRWTRQSALSTVKRAEQAFQDWSVAKKQDPLAPLFLLFLLTGDKIIPKR